MIKTRPFLVTAVCLCLLLSGTYYFIASFSYLNDPETQATMEQIAIPYPLQVAMLYLNLIIMIISAIFMLEEANWARWTYLGWGFIEIDYTLYLHPNLHDNAIAIAAYLISALILLVPSANSYFSSTIEYVDS